MGLDGREGQKEGSQHLAEHISLDIASLFPNRTTIE